ncbi:hypothetical protein PVAND_004174 [Polypedilum vanderplanki]|uniref:CCHC-type domain-containing protein n=1 Tax=Polypedilum vanderplanki TaxID=319348 RepID=A0A9J6BWW7_POLVA|nr:hypothetical protein PVAND_004174 [Polypedilum vanderplanki]
MRQMFRWILEVIQSKKDDKTSKIKPIIVDSGIAAIRNFIQNLKLKKKPMLRISGKKTQIFCETIESKKIILDKLKIQQYRFHTFTEESEKSKIFLLKGFYLEKVENVKNYLVNAGLKVKSVKIFINHEDSPIIGVQIEEKTSINALNHCYKNIDSIFVRWEVLDRSKKKLTQCYNCQQWGHSSNNCGYKSRLCEMPRVTCSCLSENFRPSINNQTFDQHVTSPTISSTQDVEKANSLLQKFNEACKKLNEIPDVEQTINNFIDMVNKLAEAKTETDRQMILVRHFNIHKIDLSNEAIQRISLAFKKFPS